MVYPSPFPSIYLRENAHSPTHSLSLLYLNLDISPFLARISLQNTQISRNTKGDLVDAKETQVTRVRSLYFHGPHKDRSKRMFIELVLQTLRKTVFPPVTVAQPAGS